MLRTTIQLAAPTSREGSALNGSPTRLGALILGVLLSINWVLAEDSRQTWGADSPLWLQAVGQLHVPGSRYEQGRRKHYREDCSATLVMFAGETSANTVITAWHCLEHYHDLSKMIEFTLLAGSPNPVTRQAYRVADGGGMHADWAILKLYEAVRESEVAALTLHPQRASAARPVTMAGYSRDSGLGARGTRLSYDDACHVTSQGREASESDCIAHKGASGGAVIQLSTSGTPQLAGVISRGDSENLSIYIPIEEFRSSIRRHLR